MPRARPASSERSRSRKLAHSVSCPCKRSIEMDSGELESAVRQNRSAPSPAFGGGDRPSARRGFASYPTEDAPLITDEGRANMLMHSDGGDYWIIRLRG